MYYLKDAFINYFLSGKKSTSIFLQFLERLGLTWEDSGISLIIFLLSCIGSLILFCWKLTLFLIQKKDELSLNKDLHPYFGKEEVRNATKFYIETRCQNVPPSIANEPRETFAFVTSQKLIPFFIEHAFTSRKNNDQRFYMILADSGMGKTTFMINLYLSYTKKNWLKKRNKIKLYPLGHFNSFEEIKQIPEKEKEQTILLLDAFDEDSHAAENYQKRFSELLDEVWRFKEVVITCRTQFFPSQEEEPHRTGLLKMGGNKGEHVFHKLYLTPFNDSDVKKFIRKKFPFFQFNKRIKAFKIVERCPNLMIRPMLLNYIEKIIARQIKIKKFKIRFNFLPFNYLTFFKFDYEFIIKTYSSIDIKKLDKVYQIYKLLIQKWIEREARGMVEGKEEFMNELYSFSKQIAINMHEMRKERDGYLIFKDDMSEFAFKHNIKLEDLEMKSKSLLNRNADGFYKFSHKSILEYFLAREAIENKKFRDNLDKTGLDFMNFLLEEQLEEDWLFKNKNKIIGSFTTDYSYWDIDISRITKEDIFNLTELKIEKTYLPSLYFVSNFTNIKTLVIRESQLSSCQSVENLRELKYLDLSKNNLSDCEVIKKLANLETLILSYNQIKSGEPIAKLINLKLLYIHNNELTNCKFLKNLKNLNRLALIHNQITDFSPILYLHDLRELFLPRSISSIQLQQIKEKIPKCKIILV